MFILLIVLLWCSFLKDWGFELGLELGPELSLEPTVVFDKNFRLQCMPNPLAYWAADRLLPYPQR